MATFASCLLLFAAAAACQGSAVPTPTLGTSSTPPRPGGPLLHKIPTLAVGTSVQQAEKAFFGEYANVKYLVEIENFSNTTLRLIESHVVSGNMRIPANSVAPWTKEAVSGAHTAAAATGAIATIVWRIGFESAQKLAIMFSVPYNHNWFENVLAIGLTTEALPQKYALYDQMYYGNNKKFFARKGYYHDTTPIKVVGSHGFSVTGSMGTSHKPKIQIILRHDPTPMIPLFSPLFPLSTLG